MMLLNEAQGNIGGLVLYRSRPTADPEPGLISSINDEFIFVRFGTGGAQACYPGMLTLVVPPQCTKDEPAASPLCVGCQQYPTDIPEYRDEFGHYGYDTPSDMAMEDGTYNRENGHFWCTECYIRAGSPFGVAP